MCFSVSSTYKHSFRSLKTLEKFLPGCGYSENVLAILIYRAVTDDYFHLYNLLIIFWKNLLAVWSTKCQKNQRWQISCFIHNPKIINLVPQRRKETRNIHIYETQIRRFKPYFFDSSQSIFRPCIYAQRFILKCNFFCLQF